MSRAIKKSDGTWIHIEDIPLPEYNDDGIPFSEAMTEGGPTFGELLHEVETLPECPEKYEFLPEF